MIPAAAVAAEVALTLDEAVTIALRDNRDVRLKEQELKKAKAAIAEAKAGLFPGLDVSAGWYDTRGLYSKDVANYSTQIGAAQLLFDGGRVLNAVKVGEHYYAANEAALDAARQALVQAVKKSFYALMFADRYCLLNKQILDNTQEHLNVAESRFAKGEASESDILEITASLENVRQAYDISANQSRSAQALLANLLYLDADVSIKTTGEFTYTPLELAYDEAFLKALKQRPEIKQLAEQRKASEKAVAIAKGGSKPVVSASWNYYSGSRLGTATAVGASPVKGWNDYNVLGVTAQWPLFDGWLTRSKVEQALIDVKQATLLEERAVKDIALELTNAFLALQEAVGQLRAAETEIAYYTLHFATVQDRFRKGMASSLDVNDAEIKQKIALFNKTQALFDYSIAKSDFEKATGGKK